MNVGGSWTPGAPVRSLYHYRLLLALCDDVGFNLCQEFFWYNPAKMPAPAEWVNVPSHPGQGFGRVHLLVVGIEVPQGRQLPRTASLQQGHGTADQAGHQADETAVRPQHHDRSFRGTVAGRFPANVIQCGNNESNSEYIKLSKKLGQKIHPARFPAELPRFFIEFLTEPGDLVLDPFAGSNTTGAVAEQLGRRWIAVEKSRTYAKDSELRFRCSSTSNGKRKGQGSLFDLTDAG